MKTKVKDLIQLSFMAREISQDCEHLVRIGGFGPEESTKFDYSEASEDTKKYLNILFRKKLTGYDSVKDSFEVT